MLSMLSLFALLLMTVPVTGLSWPDVAFSISYESAFDGLVYLQSLFHQGVDLLVQVASIDASDDALNNLKSHFASQYLADVQTALGNVYNIIEPPARLLLVLAIRNPDVSMATILITVLFLLGRWLLALYFKLVRLMDVYFARQKEAALQVFNRLRAKFGTVAEFLPLLLIIVTYALISSYSFVTVMIESKLLFVFFGYALPFLASAACVSMETSVEGLTRTERLVFENQLQYWIALAALHMVIDLPVAGAFLQSIPYWNDVRFIILVWLYFPFWSGAGVIRSMLVKTLSQISPFLVPVKAKASMASSLFNIVPNSIMPDHIKTRVRSLLSRGTPIFLAIAFFFSPRFMERYGCLVVGALMPAIYAIPVLGSHCNASETETRYWLRFSIVALPMFSAARFLEAIPISSVPFFYSFQLVAMLYLQLPAFEGARQIADPILASESVKQMLAVFAPFSIRKRRVSKANTRMPEPASLPKAKYDASAVSRSDDDEFVKDDKGPKSRSAHAVAPSTSDHERSRSASQGMSQRARPSEGDEEALE